MYWRLSKALSYLATLDWKKSGRDHQRQVLGGMIKQLNYLVYWLILNKQAAFIACTYLAIFQVCVAVCLSHGEKCGVFFLCKHS